MVDTPPPALPPDRPDFVDCAELTADLADPIASVIAVELSRRFVRLCLSWAEPMVADLSSQQEVLRRAGGADLAERMLARRLYHRIDPEAFRLLRVGVPLAHAEFALSRIEEALRDRFGDVVRAAISFLLSHDRDTAIQMLAVATTMAGRQVIDEVTAIVADTRRFDAPSP